MAVYIRILPKRQYYKRLGRFSSEAFKNYRGAISVIQLLCISRTGNTVCEHLKQYYNSVDEPPHILWEFEADIIPSKCEFKQEDSPTGDNCHYNIYNLKDKEAKRILNDHFQSTYDAQICDNTNPRDILSQDIALLELHSADAANAVSGGVKMS